ncbi:MAG: SDR family NAD(P)-dependent oxidoreductase [Solirubrobacterales bacterium]
MAPRTAIVTGGSGGFGKAITERLLADGLRVVVADRKLPADGGFDDERRLSVQVDVTSAESARAMVAMVLERWGGVDVLVNNAGIAGPTAAVADYPVADFHRVIEVNLLGVFHCSQACLSALGAGEAPRIVNISSAAGRDPNPMMSAYSTSKAGVIAFTRSLARELAGGSVLVNCVVPGVVDAGLTDSASEEDRSTFLARVPMKRMGRVEELAEMVAWVASPRCSFTTGATFDVSGGRSPI